MTDDEIKRMKAEAEANAEADKKLKEQVDKFNQADNLIFNSEKQVKEIADKISPDHKKAIEDAIAHLKEARQKEDVAAIDSAMEALNQAFHAASEELYKQNAASGQAQPNPNDGPQPGNAQNKGGDEKISDADFEEL